MACTVQFPASAAAATLRYLREPGWSGHSALVCCWTTLLWYSFRALARLRKLGHPNYPAAPVACIVIAGLVHAAFEDWLFAVGYYVTLVFWILAMSLPDLVGESPVRTSA
jgi:hypothetical protein